MKDYECGRCTDLHDDEEEVKYVKLGNDMIEVVQEFCYLVMFKVQCRLEYVLAGENLVRCLK